MSSNALIGWFLALTPRDAVLTAVDIFVVYYVVYRLLRLLRGTRAAQMLVGLLVVGLGIFAAKQFELTTLTWLLDHLFSFSIVFFIVIFQHDIRRALMRMGQGLWFTSRSYERSEAFEEIIRAAERMAQLRIGALIVIERDADLADHLTEQGIEVGAKVTEELLVSIFVPDAENKLHDGAVIVKELRIAQAGAVLPLSANARLDKALGTRHRAAIGVTEETDAVSVVVSEERGSISLCFGGNVARDLDAATLRKALLGLFQKDGKRGRQRRRTQTQASQGAGRVTGAHAVAREGGAREGARDSGAIVVSHEGGARAVVPEAPTGARAVIGRSSGRAPVLGATMPGLGLPRTPAATPPDDEEGSTTTSTADVELSGPGERPGDRGERG